MERTDVLELMSTLKLYGMRAAYDEVMATGIKVSVLARGGNLTVSARRAECPSTWSSARA